MQEWVKNTNLVGNKDIYFVITCGGSIGNTLKEWNENSMVLMIMMNHQRKRIFSRDGDFIELVKFLRNNRKRVVILAPENTSKKLKNASKYDQEYTV